MKTGRKIKQWIFLLVLTVIVVTVGAWTVASITTGEVKNPSVLVSQWGVLAFAAAPGSKPPAKPGNNKSKKPAPKPGNKAPNAAPPIQKLTKTGRRLRLGISIAALTVIVVTVAAFLVARIATS